MFKVLTKIKQYSKIPPQLGYGDFLWNNDIIEYYHYQKWYVKEGYLVWTFQEFCEELIYNNLKSCTEMWGDYWLIFHTPRELAAKVIWRYWKRFKLNVFKKHRDPLKKELMEYIWHPCRFNELLY